MIISLHKFRQLKQEHAIKNTHQTIWSQTILSSLTVSNDATWQYFRTEIVFGGFGKYCEKTLYRQTIMNRYLNTYNLKRTETNSDTE